jgi:hypothetical protein
MRGRTWYDENESGSYKRQGGCRMHKTPIPLDGDLITKIIAEARNLLCIIGVDLTKQHEKEV